MTAHVVARDVERHTHARGDGHTLPCGTIAGAMTDEKRSKADKLNRAATTTVRIIGRILLAILVFAAVGAAVYLWG